MRQQVQLWLLDALIQKKAPEDRLRTTLRMLVDIENLQGPKRTYYEFLVEKQLGNQELARAKARQLIGSESQRYQLTAAYYLASSYEWVFDPKETPNATQLKEAAKAFSTLLECTESKQSPTLSVDTKRQVKARHVDLQIKVGNFQQALTASRQLTEEVPTNLNFQVLRARALSGLGKAGEAVGIWRKIANSSPHGSENWFEAKFWIIQSLSKDKIAEAKSLFRQTVSLGGEIPKSWQSRYDDLAARLSMDP